MALLMASWVAGIVSMVPLVGEFATLVSLPLQAAGAALLVLALVRTLLGHGLGGRTRPPVA